MNRYLLSVLLAHSPSCCFTHRIKLKEDYYKWILLLYYAKIKNNSKFSSQTHSCSTTFKSMKENFKPELQEHISSSSLTTKQRNEGKEELFELSTSGSSHRHSSDTLQSPAWKPSLT